MIRRGFRRVEASASLEARARLDLTASPTWLEAAQGDKPALPGFSMVGYTGAPMNLMWWDAPVVVDLAGMKVRSQALPIRRGHDSGRVVGHTESVSVENGQVTAKGVISFKTADAQEIVDAAKNGFPWQASIGASVGKTEFIQAGSQVTVNGKLLDGPLNVVRASSLDEISFVDIGADRNTSVRVAAKEMEKEKPKEDESVKTQAELEAEAAKVAAAEAEKTAAPEPVLALRAQVALEHKRINAVLKAAGKNSGIAEKAVGEGWDLNRTELEVLRAERPATPGIVVRHEVPTADVLEASVALSGGLPGVEKKYKPEVLEAASRLFRRQMGLQELLLEGARAQGYSGRSFRSDMRGVLEAAFSTLSLPGILSNVMNKFLLQGFDGVEGTWRAIAATRNVRDFKQVSSYRLSGGMEYEEVSPDGELKHGELGEQTFHNQAKTYGKMFSITRQDLINDDLVALTQVPMRIGRGAALKLNKVFWTEFLDDAAFFTAGNKNLESTAAGAFGIDGLTLIEQMFLDQVDPDGNPLAVTPAILLVPNALSVSAAQAMRSTELRSESETGKYPTLNPHAGKFEVVRSSYLNNSAIPGGSDKAWYLLARPADLAVIEVAFLNGQETPIVESAAADFDTLGIQVRGYHDFGVAKQEPRAGIKADGQ